jgi:hypothetical protein
MSHDGVQIADAPERTIVADSAAPLSLARCTPQLVQSVEPRLRFLFAQGAYGPSTAMIASAGQRPERQRSSYFHVDLAPFTSC